GTNDVSISIPYSFDVNERGAAQTVRPFDLNLLLKRRNSGTQNIDHVAFVMRHRAAVGSKHPIRSTKSLIAIADFRRLPPKLGGLAVVPKKIAVPVTNIDRKWHMLEKRRRHFKHACIFMQIDRTGSCLCGSAVVEVSRFRPDKPHLNFVNEQ